MPDREAIKREGRGAFALRVLMFFLLLAWLGLYAVNPYWMEVLSAPFPGWLRWVGFALGLASLGFWVWTQLALGKEWSPQLQLREEHHYKEEQMMIEGFAAQVKPSVSRSHKRWSGGHRHDRPSE